MMNRAIPSLIVGCLCFVGFACTATPPETSNPSANSTAPAASPAAAPLTGLSAYNVEWVSQQIPSEMQATKWYDAIITLKNPTSATWPARGTAPGNVLVAYHWLPAQGEKPVVADGERTPFPHDIGPGETVTLNKVLVIAPPTPGAYRLQISLVHEGITWFESQGAKPITVPVTVR